MCIHHWFIDGEGRGVCKKCYSVRYFKLRLWDVNDIYIDKTLSSLGGQRSAITRRKKARVKIKVGRG